MKQISQSKENLFVWITCIFLALIAIALLHPAQGATLSNIRAFHVTGQPVPASLTVASVLEGGTTNTSVNVALVIFSNTDSSAHTVTLSDCTAGTAFVPINAGSIAANSVWLMPFYDTRFNGCFKWSASSTLVQGAVVGTR